MANPPETTMTQPDSFGRHWVYVGKDLALAHPKGKLSMLLIAIVAWFLIAGIFEIWAFTLSARLFGLFAGLLLLISAYGLFRRSEWVWRIATLTPFYFLFQLFFNIRAAGSSGENFVIAIMVANALVGFLIAFYLYEGDRPNFIYRHRYRSYKAENDAE